MLSPWTDLDVMALCHQLQQIERTMYKNVLDPGLQTYRHTDTTEFIRDDKVLTDQKEETP